MIKVLLVDDHPVVQIGLCQGISGFPDIEVIGTALGGREAVDKTCELNPDVILLDLCMPDVNGIDVTRLIKKSRPNVRVVIFSMQDREAFVHRAFWAGADGYVLKGAPINDVVKAIRDVNQGHYFVSPKIQGLIIGSFRRTREAPPEERAYEHLSDREQQVLRLLVEGNSSTQIGEKLFISSKTVDTHRANIMQKLGVETLVDLIKFAIRINILDPDEWTSRR